MYTVPFTNMAISLSGGGYRATAFHLGALSLLDSIELNMDEDPEKVSLESGRTLLKHVKILSTISGGTLTGIMYALKLAEGKGFKDCYSALHKRLSEDDLVTKALAKLNSPSSSWTNSFKTRNLINSFSEVYNEDFFVTNDEGEGATFQTLSDGKKSHLTDVIFGTTEFTTGNLFRFQHSEGGEFGSDKLSLTRDKSKLNTYKQIRLADAAAASSCFPGGFEPMIMPTDFSNGPGSGLDLEWKYGSDVATRIFKFHKACLKEAAKADEKAPGYPRLRERFDRLQPKIVKELQATYDRLPSTPQSQESIPNLTPYFLNKVKELCFTSPLIVSEASKEKMNTILEQDSELRNFRKRLQSRWEMRFTQGLDPEITKMVHGLQKKQTTGIMDGGIMDNQGRDAVLLAEKRYFDKQDDKSFIGTYIVSDVSSKTMEPYQVPSPSPSTFKDFFTLNRVNLIAGVVIAIVLALILPNGATFWGAVGATIVLTAAVGWFLIFFFLRSTFRKQIVATLLGESPGKDITEDKERIVKDLNFFLKTPLHVLVHLIQFRASSAIKMIAEIFLKRIRTLQEKSMYPPNMVWNNRLVQNNLYDLKGKYDNHAIGKIIDAANRMPTTLWFTEKEQKNNTALRDLIACGQLTLCKNLIEYLEDFYSKNEEGVLEFTDLGKPLSDHQKSQLLRLNKQLVDFWGRFEKNGHWLVDQYRVVV